MQVGTHAEIAVEPRTDTGEFYDTWENRPYLLVRIHNAPRRAMFDVTTCDDPPPIPMNCVDVEHRTITSLENHDEQDIRDFADGIIACRRELSEPWAGETRYHKLWKCPEGLNMIDGRMTSIQSTSRPPHVWPEVLQSVSKKQRETSVYLWATDKKARDEARARRGLIVGVHGGGTQSHRLYLSHNSTKPRGLASQTAKLGWRRHRLFPIILFYLLGPLCKNIVKKKLQFGITSTLLAWWLSKSRSRRL